MKAGNIYTNYKPINKLTWKETNQALDRVQDEIVNTPYGPNFYAKMYVLQILTEDLVKHLAKVEPTEEDYKEWERNHPELMINNKEVK